MEIKTTWNRFLSIFLIVALGVAFFAGIRATNPDMRITADRYFDQSKLMDLKVISTWGLTEKDISAIAELEGVEAVEPVYSTYVVCDTGENELVLNVMSETEQTNLIHITEGRLPSIPEEVLVDTFFIDHSGYRIGDTIHLTSGTEADLTDTLSREDFMIVGIGTSPEYLSFQRGTTTIGSGDVDSFIVIKPEVFTSEVYSGAYITVEGARELTAFTDKYDNKVVKVQEAVKGIAEDLNNTRYEAQYNKSAEELLAAKEELDLARQETQTKLNEGLASLQNLPLSKEQLDTAAQELKEADRKAQEEFEKTEGSIRDSEQKLSELKAPEWYVLDRTSIESYVEYEQNADRIGAIGKVFPVIFFLVAALISLTTMTRMVEEERIQIGTLKALGYSKKTIAGKYILYALFATLGGSITGALIGLKLLPTVIITAYKMLYRSLPGLATPFNSYYAGLATLCAVFSVGLATFFACYKELKAKPAELMRPVAPKNGKRVLLEKISFLWNRLSFIWKATIRNLFRYKKRFFMTVFGIGGCMSLLLVGFGLKDSIFVIYTRQFDEIMLYNSTVGIEENATDGEIASLEKAMSGHPQITSYAKARVSSANISHDNGKEESVQLVIFEKPELLRDYIVLRSRTKHMPYELSEDGIVITEQIAKKLGVREGDTLTIKVGEEKADTKVHAVTENYLTHYIYMTPSLYQHLYGSMPGYNQYYLETPGADEISEQEIGNDLLESPAVSGIFYVSYFRNLLDNILVSLNIVVWVLIISAGALAFIVLYNLNNININERRRELATIKVLGFYDNELSAYVYRENIILTLIGMAVGLVLGIFLHRYVIETVEINLVMFGRNIDWSSYGYSLLLTLFFSAIVNFVMFFKLRKINMVESLKSVE
jgi:putative ABC transport system permease protein